jgi:hypothetical protein
MPRQREAYAAAHPEVMASPQPVVVWEELATTLVSLYPPQKPGGVRMDSLLLLRLSVETLLASGVPRRRSFSPGQGCSSRA